MFHSQFLSFYHRYFPTRLLIVFFFAPICYTSEIFHKTIVTFSSTSYHVMPAAASFGEFADQYLDERTESVEERVVLRSVFRLAETSSRTLGIVLRFFKAFLGARLEFLLDRVVRFVDEKFDCCSEFVQCCRDLVWQCVLCGLYLSWPPNWARLFFAGGRKVIRFLFAGRRFVCDFFWRRPDIPAGAAGSTSSGVSRGNEDPKAHVPGTADSGSTPIVVPGTVLVAPPQFSPKEVFSSSFWREGFVVCLRLSFGARSGSWRGGPKRIPHPHPLRDLLQNRCGLLVGIPHHVHHGCSSAS